MKKTIDCLFIGHNEIDFLKYEETIRKMGKETGAYRNLNRNFLRCNNTPYNLTEMFNLFHFYENPPKSDIQRLNLSATLSPAIAYLGTYLHNHGLTFDYVNSFQDEKEALAEKLKQENILTIAILTTLYVNAFPIIEIRDFIRKYNSTAEIIIGGPFIYSQFCALEPRELELLYKFIRDADVYVISCQGETTLVRVINRLKENLTLEQIPNIAFKSGDGYITTPTVEETNVLSENPVNWNLFANSLGDFLEFRTSISCPFSCMYCGYPRVGGRYQNMDIPVIERELNQVQKIGKVKSIHFIDDTLNAFSGRFKDLLRMIARNKYTFKWNSYFRCQFADREMVELMKESGCEGVFLGLESGSNEILKKMNKRATVEKYQNGIQLLKEYEITTFGSFIIGFPGETQETVHSTIEFIKESNLDFYRASLWYYWHLTPVWEKREQFNLSGSNYEWSHMTMDSRTASDLIDQMFVSIENPLWVPLYNFDFASIYHLTGRGMPLEQVRKILSSFNHGVREKLLDTSREEVSADALKQIKMACQGINVLDEKIENRTNILDKYDADFDY